MRCSTSVKITACGTAIIGGVISHVFNGIHFAERELLVGIFRGRAGYNGERRCNQNECGNASHNLLSNFVKIVCSIVQRNKQTHSQSKVFAVTDKRRYLLGLYQSHPGLLLQMSVESFACRTIRSAAPLAAFIRKRPKSGYFSTQPIGRFGERTSGAPVICGVCLA